MAATWLSARRTESAEHRRAAAGLQELTTAIGWGIPMAPEDLGRSVRAVLLGVAILVAFKLCAHVGRGSVARAFCVAALLFGLVGGVRSAAAQPSGFTLQLTASHARVAPGGTLRISIGAFNQGAPVPMDVYCVALLPDGDTLFALRGAAGMVGGRLSRVAAIPPLVANVTLPTGFATTLHDFLTHTFTGAEPGGTYRFLLAAVRPGSLADGRVDGDDLLAVASRDVTLGPPLTTEVDLVHSASGTVTPLDGGSVTTTAADGTTYTLEVPAGAVPAATTITLTPVTGMSGLGQPLSRLAAVRAEPSGLQFARPARLTIDIPAGVPPTAMAALLISDGGTRGEVTPVAAGATRLAIQIAHFSDLVVPLLAADLIAQFGQSSFYETAMVLFPLTEAGVPPFRDHVVSWYDTRIRVLLQSGQGDQDALAAGLVELAQWDLFRAAFERDFGGVIVDGSPARGQLTGRGLEGRTLAVTGLAQAFARANDRCLAGTAVNARLADADAAASFASLAQDYFDTLAQNQSLSPAAVQIASPDLAAQGLDAASVGGRICVKLRIDDVVVPDLGPGETGTLTVVAGFTFAGGPTAFAPEAGVAFCPDPAGIDSGCTLFMPTNAAGQMTFPVTATPSGVVRYAVCAHISQDPGMRFMGLFLALAFPGPVPCRTSVGGVVVTPSQTVIAPGASRQFTAIVEDTFRQEVAWAVSGGGVITQTGLFTSNGTPGTFFVTATSVADPDSVGIAQVTVTGSGGEEGPCPAGCTFPGTFTFCHEGRCNAPTQGSVRALTFRPLVTNGRTGNLVWQCDDMSISADISRNGTSFTGNITRASSNTIACREVGTNVGTPLTGSLSAQALNFVLNVNGTTTTLTFASTGVAAPASSRENR